MSFSGQSNAPWQRNNLNVMSGNFHQGQHQHGPPPMFVQAPPQQTNMAAFGHAAMQAGGIFPPGSGGGAVAYPQPRTGLNPVAFQQAPGGGGQSQHYNSIGTVTKINSDCGLVNDEVFFYRNVCKGHAPKLGDRVLFEANYSTSGQFKWNATRIQLMPSHQPQPLMGTGSGKGSSGYNAVPPPGEYQGGRQQQRRGSPRRSSPSGGGRDRHGGRNERRVERERIHRSRDRDEVDEHDRKRRREDHGRSRERNNIGNSSQRDAAGSGNNAARDIAKRDHDHSLDRGKERVERVREQRVERERHRGGANEHDKDRAEERSPHRSTVKGRRTRTIRRYMVQIPKALLSYKHADIQELRQRYATLYIPSDFFHANIKWSESFTPDNSFSLRRPCQFHIMHRIVEPPFDQKPEFFEAPDADYLYSAKVMLMACPPLAELYQKCFEEDDGDNEQHTVHPSRLISFLVGTRSRNEPMAIGGPWSKSLDGENPDKDPSVLIRTAIRTCRALTGIDLSHCTQWYRFVELYYHRTDHKTSKDKNATAAAPARIETVVIYLPDIHSCMPSTGDWLNLMQTYKTSVENVIARKMTSLTKAAAKENSTGTATLANSSSNDSKLAADETEKDEADAAQGANNEESTVVEGDEADGVEEAAEETPAASATVAETPIDTATDVAPDGDDNDNEKDNEAPEPSHYSQLDLKSMKVQDIRNELIARNLPSKGIRNLIMARLAKAINAEKANEASAKKSANKKQVKTPNVKNKSGTEKMAVADANESNTVEQKRTTQKEESTNKKNDDCETNDNDDAKANTDENDEQEEWADVIDVDMSDIVILDEYDSSKNPEETPKELDEKEKNQLIRRYTLPAAPHILVHPSKTAKGGKFDCSVMSLSVLLDYRPEDTKERFFEVSLFAELFNEMLQRDFGFNIYKELYLYKAPESETKSDESTNNKKEESNTGGAHDDDEKSTKDNAAETTSMGDKSSSSSARERRTSKRSMDEEPTASATAEDDSQSAKSSADRKRKSTASSSIKDGDRNKDKDREIGTDKKMVVVKPQLLLSFVYFDTSHCGYIFEKDLEELFTILGLNLSRGQIRKVLGKLATRQAFYYRKLTDKEESIEATPTIEDVDDVANEELKKIALGNRLFDNIFGSNEKALQNNENKNITANDDGLINHNGAVIHVGKLMEQIKRTEKNFSDLEKLYNDLRKQHTDLHRDHSKSSSKIKDLQSETKSLNRKLTDADSALFSLNRKYRDQNSTLSYVFNRVSPYFNREKDNKDHKSESSRDKDSDKDKDKDSKDKEKSTKDKDSRDKEKSTKEHVKDEDKQKNRDKDKSKKNGDKDKTAEIEIKEENTSEVVKDEENVIVEDEEMETNDVEEEDDENEEEVDAGDDNDSKEDDAKEE